MIDSLQSALSRWRLVLGLAGFQLLLSFCVLTPWTQALESGGLAQLPQSSSLMQHGGLLLVEWVRLEGPQLLAAIEASVWLALVALLVLLLPLALLLAALHDPSPLSLERHGLRTLRALPSLCLLQGAAFLLRVLVVMGLMLSWSAGSALVSPPEYPGLLVSAGVVLLLLWVWLGVWHDLARAHVIAQEASGVPAALAGLRTLLSGQWQILMAYLGPASAGLALLLVVVMGLNELEKAGLHSVWLDFLAHQLALAGLLLLRAAWLSRALSLASSSLPAPGDRHVDNAEQGDPNPSPCA